MPGVDRGGCGLGEPLWFHESDGLRLDVQTTDPWRLTLGENAFEGIFRTVVGHQDPRGMVEEMMEIQQIHRVFLERRRQIAERSGDCDGDRFGVVSSLIMSRIHRRQTEAKLVRNVRIVRLLGLYQASMSQGWSGSVQRYAVVVLRHIEIWEASVDAVDNG